ncbi:GPI transamidase subunit PIGU [Acanthamoeba castellanii str. Neff]|uniref:GPI transamidase subunit PIGU n=1 Tax=Acanthamoeba castellanii (strain ATCC 30010 / Neff) TaxID=1257118 RepID=L8GHE5_ACACF|nr:GPI transamidase subunit PIGU [Acanthamoeba castellanii str. Neff]ELR12158.1 GPI transamidase subunit PIGU [Acanthamoeba castellanii str. Neff]
MGRRGLNVVVWGSAFALGVRCLLFAWEGLPELLSTRIELVTPVTSYNRLKEGLYLVESGLSPYAGDAYHQAPLLLWFFSFFFSSSMPQPSGEALTAAAAYLPTISHYATPALFIFTDFFIAFLLMFLSQNYLAHPTFTASSSASSSNAPSPSSPSSSSTSSSSSPTTSSPSASVVAANFNSSTSPPLTGEIVFCVYLTNPWTILTCVAQSTIVFNNLAVVLCLYAAVKGNVWLATLCLALGTYLSLYPALLIFPLVAIFHTYYKQPVQSAWVVGFAVVACYAVWLSALFYLSFLQLGSWGWLKEVYGFIFFAPDLTPNIGLFWYYFTEAFMHFRPFFIFVFQYHPVIYVLPLTVRFRRHGVFLFWIFMGLIGMLKSYPCIGDMAPYISLLPLFHVLNLAQNKRSVFICLGFVYLNVVGPIMWHLWINQGTGNANFFYAMTLIFFLFQGWLVRDCLTSASVLDDLMTQEEKQKTKKAQAQTTPTLPTPETAASSTAKAIKVD